MVKKSWIPIRLLCLLYILAVPALFPLEVGDDAPGFANPRLDGSYVLSKDIVKKGWILIDFFETTCEPCKKELPELEKLHGEFSAVGLSALIFAADQQGVKVVAPYFKEHPTVMTVLIDRYRVAVDKFGIKQIPTLFLIDPHGKVVLKVEGYFEETIGKIRSIILHQPKQ